MKKVILLFLVGLFAVNAAFSCESPFDDIEGMTCELQCVLCSDKNIDIKVCDEVKEKFKQYEEDFTIANEKCGKAKRAAKELEIKAKALEKELVVDRTASSKIVKLIVEAQELRRIARDAADISNAVLINFLGEDTLKLLMENKEFYNEVEKVVDKYRGE